MTGRKVSVGRAGAGRAGAGKQKASGRSRGSRAGGKKRGRQGVQNLVVTLRRQGNPPNVREAVLTTRLNQFKNQLRTAKNALVAVVSSRGAGTNADRGPQAPFAALSPFAVEGPVKEARGVAGQRLEAANQNLASATQRLENVARQLNTVMRVEIMLRQALTNLRVQVNTLTANNNMRLAMAMRAGDAAGAAAIRAEHAAAKQTVLNDGVRQKGRLRELLAKKIDLQEMYRQSTDEYTEADEAHSKADRALADLTRRPPRMKKPSSRRRQTPKRRPSSRR